MDKLLNYVHWMTKEYANHCEVSKKTHRRWCKLLVKRAVIHYINRCLDEAMAEEDLYDGDQDNRNIAKPTYPNLKYSEFQINEQIARDTAETKKLFKS